MIKVTTACCQAPLCLDDVYDYLCSQCGLFYGKDNTLGRSGEGTVLTLLDDVKATVLSLEADGMMSMTITDPHPTRWKYKGFPVFETFSVVLFEEA